jgi:hypothetical protein
MVVMRVGADKLSPGVSGPEQYAPPDRRPGHKLRDVDQAAANAFEDEIRELVQRSLPHQQQSDTGPAPENLNNLIGRVASASIAEIDQVILELQGVRDMLRNEGERLSHEIFRFTSLNQASMIAVKAVADSLKKSKGAQEEA